MSAGSLRRCAAFPLPSSTSLCRSSPLKLTGLVTSRGWADQSTPERDEGNGPVRVRPPAVYSVVLRLRLSVGSAVPDPPQKQHACAHEQHREPQEVADRRAGERQGRSALGRLPVLGLVDVRDDQALDVVVVLGRLRRWWVALVLLSFGIVHT